MSTRSFTAIVEREGDLYVALCPGSVLGRCAACARRGSCAFGAGELDVASQGASVEEATANLKEAVELFLESADPEEVAQRLRGELYVTRFEAAHG